MADDSMIKETLKDAEQRMGKAVDSLSRDLAGIRTGRASPSLVEQLRVDYYGTPTPLQQLASVGVPDARLLTIQPYDKGSLEAIEKAIQKSDLGLNPSNDGNIIRLAIPQLTEERRRVRFARAPLGGVFGIHAEVCAVEHPARVVDPVRDNESVDLLRGKRRPPVDHPHRVAGVGRDVPYRLDAPKVRSRKLRASRLRIPHRELFDTVTLRLNARDDACPDSRRPGGLQRFEPGVGSIAHEPIDAGQGALAHQRHDHVPGRAVDPDQHDAVRRRGCRARAAAHQKGQPDRDPEAAAEGLN